MLLVFDEVGPRRDGTVAGMDVSNQYDVIVVGARCAGAATARLLAARGHQVLLLDRAHHAQ